MTPDPWMSAMRRGDFEAAWQISDRILRQRMARAEDCSHRPRHLQFLWKGEPLDSRRVLVRCFHGLGDTIQFVRLLALLRKRACHVALAVQPALVGLLRTVAGIDRLLLLSEGPPEAEHDVQIELMELPHALRLTPEAIPARVPYIYVSPASPPRAPDRSLHVGIAWRSGEWNPDRSVPDATVSLLARVPGVRWHSLQYGVSDAPLEASTMACRDIHLLAARMRSLDLVISVDTMTAHLAGALGLPTWTLLHHDCDWRWMGGRDTSPWYPTMRLFRQCRAGDWPTLIDRVCSALAQTTGLGGAIRALDTRSAGCTVS